MLFRSEEDTLSSYPLTVEEQSVDTVSMITTLMGEQNNEEHDLDKVYSSNIMTDIINSMTTQLDTNNLEEFKKFLDGSHVSAEPPVYRLLLLQQPSGE